MHAPSNFRSKSCATAVAGALMFWSGLAQAQSASEPEIEEIVTTGSRIARTNGFETPTPVSVLGEEEIEAEAPGSVAEFVMTLPSVQGSSTASTNSGALSSGGAGVAALNLRSLGTGRTLVLFDGQRSVVSTSTGQVDTNTFPQPLVQRVEVVTGGASSAYGSDAISGVVNFILDKRFTGLKTEMDYGATTYGDNDSQSFSLTAGSPFANGAGHVLFSTEWYQKDGVHYTARDWARKGYWGILNPDRSPGQPHFIRAYDIGISGYTPGGLITSGPLRGTYFGEGGSVNQLDYGATSGQWMLGGDWRYPGSEMLGSNSLSADDERQSFFGRASYELGSGIEVFGQASWAGYEGLSYYVRPTHTGVTIQADNAFLPGELRDQMTALGLSSFTFASNNIDMPASGSNNKRDTARFVVGANGDFLAFDKGWSWDSYYQKGITETDEHMTDTFNFGRVALATDAVLDPVSGEVVCRSTLADPANGCVPLNRFGIGVASEEALEYVLGRPRREQEFEQDVAAINFSTNDFEGWAGPISLAFGAEYRKERMDGEVDPMWQSGWKYGNYKVTAGEYDVREAYAETVVPIMDRLEFNAAARYTDYSTSGGVKTWKAGLTWAPIDDVTFRVTKSKDIRAPNLSELFDAGTARTNAVAISGQSTPFVQNLQGTTTVGPEEAETLGVGVIMQPRFLPGLALSADYYDIEIDGVIGFVAAQEVADYCFQDSVQRYCDQMRYDANGVLQFIDLYYENLTSQLSKGVDYEASYTFGLYDLIDGAPGDVSLRLMATNYIDDIEDDGVRIVENAGSNAGSTPDWVYRFTLGYTLDTWRFNLTGRGVSDGVVNNDYIECASNCPPSTAPNFTINDNGIDGEIYFDAYVSKSFTFAQAESEAFLSVKNIFDTDPVLLGNPASQGAENTPAYPPTNRNLYDTMGMNFRLGMRVQF